MAQEDMANSPYKENCMDVLTCYALAFWRYYRSAAAEVWLGQLEQSGLRGSEQL